MIREKPAAPRIPTMPPIPGRLGPVDGPSAGPDRSVLADLLEQFPGITPEQAAAMLQRLEEARKADGRQRYMEAMQKIGRMMNPGLGQEAATYGPDGTLIRGVEQPGAPPPPTPAQPPRMQPPRPQPAPGMAQPIQPPPPGTPYGQPLNTTPPGSRQGGDMGEQPFSRPTGNEYGARMGDGPDARRLADFMDRDGDGIDDRYQAGPGMPRAPVPRPPYAAGPHYLPARR